MTVKREDLGAGKRTAEPGGRALAESVRDHLLGDTIHPLPPRLEARLRATTAPIRVALISAVVVGFGEAVGQLARGGLVEPEVEERLLRTVIGCGIRALDFDVDGALSRLARASARRELQRGQLPAWHVGTKGLVEMSPHAIWVFPTVRVLAGSPSDPPSSWAPWAHSDRAFEEGLSRNVELTGLELVGKGRLVVEADGIRLDSPQRWLHLALRVVQALDLRSDGVILHTEDRRFALIDGDGWFMAELLRLVRGSAPT